MSLVESKSEESKSDRGVAIILCPDHGRFCASKALEEEKADDEGGGGGVASGNGREEKNFG